MGEILALAVLIVLTGVGLVAFFAVLEVFFPRRIERTYLSLKGGLGRSFLIGVVNFVFFGAVALAFFALAKGTRIEILGAIGLIALIPPAVGVVFGLAGVTAFVSQRIAPQADGIQRKAWGTLTLTLACGLPFVGWFALLPYVSLLGLGAFTAGLFRREQTVSIVDSESGSDAI